MKHLIMALAMLALAPKAMADSDMNFIRGNACIVNDQQKCVVEVDYSDLNIEGKPCHAVLARQGRRERTRLEKRHGIVHKPVLWRNGTKTTKAH